MAAAQKGILEGLVLCLSAVVSVVVQLSANMVCLNPHLQKKKMQQLLLPTADITIYYETKLLLVTFFFGAHCCV